jgi:hypothetical protein
MASSTSLDKDRRLSEFWLQEALELSLYERFCTSKAERALILHAKRHGSLSDFALLDENRKLILVELKRGRLTTAAAKRAQAQVVDKYLNEYLKLALGELATWYCQHGVDVNVWFEYRGEYCLQPGPDAGSRYGRLIHCGSRNVPHYLEGAADPDKALEILREDYSNIVGKQLDDLGGDARLEVSRCILIAEDWPTDFVPKPVNGVAFELWTYPAPTEWAKPK